MKTGTPMQSHKYLGFLMLAFVMVLAFANWFDPRLVNIFGLTTDAGTLIFPLSFLLSDLITEVYGYKHARRAIWLGFLFNLLFIAYGQLVIHLPGPAYPNHNAMFDQLLGFNIRIILASVISYLCSEPLNSFIMAKLKIKMHGRSIGFRFVFSTFIAAGFDSAIFGTIAFYNLMSLPHLGELIIVMWLIKVAIEVLCLPISIRLANKLKQVENLDVYDDNTKFNIFSLDGCYLESDNRYKNEDI